MGDAVTMKRKMKSEEAVTDDELKVRIAELRARKIDVAAIVRHFADELEELDRAIGALEHETHRRQFRLLQGGGKGPARSSCDATLVKLHST